MIGSKAGEQEVGRIDGHERIRPTHDQLSPCGDVNKAHIHDRIAWILSSCYLHEQRKCMICFPLGNKQAGKFEVVINR